MKEYIIVVFSLIAIGVSHGSRAGPPGGFNFDQSPVCKCNEIDACVRNIESNVAQCARDCSSMLGDNGVSVSGAEQCMALAKQGHQELKQCLDSQLGKMCDDGTGTIRNKRNSPPVMPPPFPHQNVMEAIHKRFPDFFYYQDCVHSCVRGKSQGMGMPQGDSAPVGPPAPPPGFPPPPPDDAPPPPELHCVMQLGCRPVEHDMNKARQAQRYCDDFMDAKSEQKMQQLSQCLKNAGFYEVQA